jgi:hypothetical protein
MVICKTFINFPSSLFGLMISGVSCLDKTCLAVGRLNSDLLRMMDSLLLISHDEGSSWSTLSNIPNHPLSSAQALLNIDCSADTCIAVGLSVIDENSSIHPILLVSHDRAQSWTSVASIANLPPLADLNAISA